jgi:hypothetical protein
MPQITSRVTALAPWRAVIYMRWHPGATSSCCSLQALAPGWHLHVLQNTGAGIVLARHVCCILQALASRWHLKVLEFISAGTFTPFGLLKLK